MQLVENIKHIIQRDRLTDVTDDVAGLPLSLVNVYFVGRPGAGDRQWVLVDTGIMFSGGTIRRAAAERFGEGSRPAAIVLTHGHFDHVGSVRGLANDWDVPVYAHRLELPYLTGRSSYPPPDPTVGGGLMADLARFYPRGPIDLGDRVRPLPDDGSVPHLPGWKWLHTPGHTAGHVSLWREGDRTLIAGDAFVTVRQESALAVLMLQQEVWRPPAYYTPDWEQAGRSVAMLADLEPEIAATGHGVPMRGDELRGQLHDLADHFRQQAVPENGRYVGHPAVTDEQGVVSVPPAADDGRAPMLLKGVAAAALAGAAVLGVWGLLRRGQV